MKAPVFDIDARVVFECAGFLTTDETKESMFRSVWVEAREHGVVVVGCDKHMMLIHYDPTGSANRNVTLAIDPTSRSLLDAAPERKARLCCDGSTVAVEMSGVRSTALPASVLSQPHNDFMFPNWRKTVPDEGDCINGWPRVVDTRKLAVIAKLHEWYGAHELHVYHEPATGKGVIVLPNMRTVLLLLMPLITDMQGVSGAFPEWLDKDYDPAGGL